MYAIILAISCVGSVFASGGFHGHHGGGGNNIHGSYLYNGRYGGRKARNMIFG